MNTNATHRVRKGALLSFLLYPCLMLTAAASAATATATATAAAPYPQSTLITGVSWDLSTVSSLRKAVGSDLWPSAWGADGNLYGAWGDGGGFGGSQDSVSAGRTSVGFALISGTPQAGNTGSLGGTNIWGQAPAHAKHQATFGGKVSEMFSVDGVLYGEANVWTAADCRCSDPTALSGGNKNNRRLIWSMDSAQSWNISPWQTASAFGSFLQFGPDYQGAFDPEHLYFYYSGDANSDPSHVYLRRMARSAVQADPASPGHFEYFAGVDSSGAPFWTPFQGNAQPVFTDSNSATGQGTGLGVVFDAPLGRYVATESHGELTGQIGLFEAPSPWGPWSTIAYYDDWGGFNATSGEANGQYFPAKWISSDGLSLWAVFSGLGDFDSLNVARAVLQVNNTPPQTPVPVGEPTPLPDPSNPPQQTGEVGHWLSVASQFDGDGAALRISDSGALANLYKGGVTVSAWIRPAASGSGGRGRIVDKDNNDAGWFFSMYTASRIQFAVDQFDGANPSRISTAGVDVNRWQHVAATWDGSTSGANIHLYVDGVPADGSAVDGSGSTYDDSGSPLTIGNRSGDLARGFAGGIEDVLVYDRVLTPAEIQTLAAAKPE